MTIGAYQSVVDFAYPGWRLTVPGGPAGGHYKGFTHTEATGTTILPGDQYEQDRGDGMSSHDAVHASQRNPRGIYRSSGEVPPRPNASGSAATYRSFQTRRHAGTSEAPGSFPADFKETGEDDFLSLAENAPHYFKMSDFAPSLLGAESNMVRFQDTCPAWGCGGPKFYQGQPTATQPTPVVTPGPGVTVVSAPTSPAAPAASCPSYGSAPSGTQWLLIGTDNNNCPVYESVPLTGATSSVAQPAGTLAPAPPAPSVPVYTVPPVSPQPSPVVATNEVIPLNDGSGNYINISTGAIVSPSQVSQNLATMQLTTASTLISTGQLIPATDGSGNYINPQTGAVIPGEAISQSSAAVPAAAVTATTDPFAWLEGSTLISGIPNWGIAAAAVVGAALLFGKHR
jgi:hypothetical protein